MSLALAFNNWNALPASPFPSLWADTPFWKLANHVLQQQRRERFRNRTDFTERVPIHIRIRAVVRFSADDDTRAVCVHNSDNQSLVAWWLLYPHRSVRKTQAKVKARNRMS